MNKNEVSILELFAGGPTLHGTESSSSSSSQKNNNTEKDNRVNTEEFIFRRETLFEHDDTATFFGKRMKRNRSAFNFFVSNYVIPQ